MASAEVRLRDRRRHRETFALALQLGCSLDQARRLRIKQHSDQRRRRAGQDQPDASAEPDSPWWQRI
jgi:hypothetical protein